MRLTGPLLVDGPWTDVSVVCLWFVVWTKVCYADLSSFPASFLRHVGRVSRAAHVHAVVHFHPHV